MEIKKNSIKHKIDVNIRISKNGNKNKHKW